MKVIVYIQSSDGKINPMENMIETSKMISEKYDKQAGSGSEDMFNFLRVQPYRSHEQLLRHHDLRVRQNHLYLNGRTRYNNNYSGWNIRIGGRW